MERGTQTCSVEKTLFRRMMVLLPNMSESTPLSINYPFSVILPPRQDNTTDPLPPSFVQFSAGNSVEIRYRILIEVTRSGLRRRER